MPEYANFYFCPAGNEQIKTVIHIGPSCRSALRGVVLDASEAPVRDALVLLMKAGEGGRTFGSISTKEIAEAAKKQLGLELDKKKMILKDPIKSLGTYEIQIKLHPQVTGTFSVHVSEG